jgi:hypothetical protein
MEADGARLKKAASNDGKFGECDRTAQEEGGSLGKKLTDGRRKRSEGSRGERKANDFGRNPGCEKKGVQGRRTDSVVGAKERCECVRAVAERVWPNTKFSAAPSSLSMVVLLQKSGRRRERNEVVTGRSKISRRIPKESLCFRLVIHL